MIKLAQIFGLNEQHLVPLQQGEHSVLLHKDVISPFTELKQLAMADNINLCIASSYRSFQRQALIWNEKFAGKRPVYDKSNVAIDMSRLTDWQKVQAILNFSALPGTSRHHWGTDMDVYDTQAMPADYQLQLVPSEYQADGVFAKLDQWLEVHASQFDFYRPYMATEVGVSQELWHLSYGPTAEAFSTNFAKDNTKLLPHLENQVSGYKVIREYFDTILADYVFCAGKYPVNTKV